MNPFKVQSGDTKKKQSGRRTRKIVGGRTFRQYEDDDPDVKYYGKAGEPTKHPISDHHYVRQIGKNIISKYFSFPFTSIGCH